MTRDDIIKMAREAKLPYEYDTGRVVHLKELERFAELVAAAEREACAYRTNIALLGADRGLANRINHAIRNGT